MRALRSRATTANQLGAERTDLAIRRRSTASSAGSGLPPPPPARPPAWCTGRRRPAGSGRHQGPRRPARCHAASPGRNRTSFSSAAPTSTYPAARRPLLVMARWSRASAVITSSASPRCGQPKARLVGLDQQRQRHRHAAQAVEHRPRRDQVRLVGTRWAAGIGFCSSIFAWPAPGPRQPRR